MVIGRHWGRLAVSRFPGRISSSCSLMRFSPAAVVVGLIVYMLLTRAGRSALPGAVQPHAMIIAQCCSPRPSSSR